MEILNDSFTSSEPNSSTFSNTSINIFVLMVYNCIYKWEMNESITRLDRILISSSQHFIVLNQRFCQAFNDTMNKKNQTDADILLDRANDLEYILFEVNLIRVFKCKELQDKNGQFSFQKWKTMQGFLYNWFGGEIDKSIPSERAKYNKYIKVWNRTLGIPKEVIDRVLGKYDSGRRVKLEDALNIIGGKRKWKIWNKGHKRNFNTNEVEASWFRKITFRELKTWNRYLSGSIPLKNTTPSSRVKKIMNWWDTMRINAINIENASTTSGIPIEHFLKRIRERNKKRDFELIEKYIAH